MYYKIITSEVPVELRQTGTAELIQLSDRKLRGFEEVIEDAQPEYNAETHYLSYEYKIIDNVVHKVYEAKEKIEEEREGI